MKKEVRNRKWSLKHAGIEIGRIRTCPFSSVYDFIVYLHVSSKTRLSENKTEAEEQTNHNARHRTLVYFARFAFAYDCDNLVLTRS